MKFSMGIRLVAATALLAAQAAPVGVHADTKTFAYTYPARTIPQGEMELEHYLDVGLNGWDDPATAEKEENDWGQVHWQHTLEYEYGITDAWDFGLYNVLEQKPFGTLQYKGVKLRTRYNFAEGKNWLVQPGIYVEAMYFGDEIKFEEMLILSLQRSVFETSLNLKWEQEIEGIGPGEEEVAHEFIATYAAGVHLGSQAALSLEYYGKMKIEHGEKEYGIHYLGPTFHVAAGPFYWNIAVQPQLGRNDEKAAVRIRSLFSVLF